MRATLALLFLLWPAGSATAGQHHLNRARERAKRLQVTIDFLDPSGQTTADDKGTTYQSGGWSYTDTSLVYFKQCQGTYPLYFIGQTLHFNVTIKNNAERGEHPYKIRVQALSSLLQTTCLPGTPLANQNEMRALKPGESITIPYELALNDPSLPSGLDVTDVKVYHVDDEDDREDDHDHPESVLVAEKNAYWCPPNRIPGMPAPR